MHVLARQVGLCRLTAQVLLNSVGMGVHARLDIRGIVELAIPCHALVVNWTGLVQLVTASVHAAEHLAAVGLVTQ